MHMISNFIIILALVVILCGMIGLLRAKGFYRCLLVSSLLDTAGLLLLLVGLALRQGLTAFSLKILLLIAATILTSPLITHKLGRSAYLSGHREEEAEYDE